MIYAALRALLLTLDAVTALLPQNAGSEDYVIRPERLRQSDPTSGTMGIEIRIPGDDGQLDLGGVAGAWKADVVFACVADSPDAAIALADAVRTNGTDPGTGIEGYSGTIGGVEIDSILLTRRIGGVRPLSDGSDSGEFAVELHCSVWYQA